MKTKNNISSRFKQTILFVTLILSIKAQGQDATAIITAFSKSYELEYAQKYNEAIAPIQKIYAADSYEINLRLGWLTYESGDYQKSISFYKKAIELKPKSVEAMLGLVYPVSSMGNWDEVITIYEKILKVDPSNYTVNYRMSLIWYNRKKNNNALMYSKILAELFPFDYENNLLLGKINIGLGNILEAKICLNKALLYNPLAQEPTELLKGL